MQGKCCSCLTDHPRNVDHGLHEAAHSVNEVCLDHARVHCKHCHVAGVGGAREAALQRARHHDLQEAPHKLGQV